MLRFIEPFRRLNGLMLACMVALLAVGVAFVYSSCSVREDASLRMLYMRHLEVGVLGLAVYFLLARCNYRTLMEWSGVLYAGCLVLLVLVLVPSIGEAKMGARRWLFGIQPAEPAKLAVVMMLAWLFGRRVVGRGAVGLLAAAAVAGVPAALILIQPDLGTAMVLVPTVFAMLFAANVAPRLVWPCVGAGALLAGTLMGLVYAAEQPGVTPERRERLIALTHLKDHQVRRLQVFLFPGKDIHGSGYNLWQSQLAVGSGGAWGKGYLKGEQYSLGYLPPSVSSNDFIFAVLAEEAGFAGSLAVLLLFSLLLGSGTWVAFRCQDDTGRLFCVGILTLTFSHTFINMAMTIGMMPITGLPLPFISYGRTFVLTMMAAFGLVQSVSIHGRESETRF
ncbi:MAG: rod shape-determining protein RodA [Verrucomicrobiota bacterium]|nr:rod shape-determining protein RodA [Verrucomicrobiota bacterium]